MHQNEKFENPAFILLKCVSHLILILNLIKFFFLSFLCFYFGSLEYISEQFQSTKRKAKVSLEIILSSFKYAVFLHLRIVFLFLSFAKHKNLLFTFHWMRFMWWIYFVNLFKFTVNRDEEQYEAIIERCNHKKKIYH